MTLALAGGGCKNRGTGSLGQSRLVAQRFIYSSKVRLRSRALINESQEHQEPRMNGNSLTEVFGWMWLLPTVQREREVASSHGFAAAKEAPRPQTAGGPRYLGRYYRDRNMRFPAGEEVDQMEVLFNEQEAARGARGRVNAPR
jgi:hypothetical protein